MNIKENQIIITNIATFTLLAITGFSAPSILLIYWLEAFLTGILNSIKMLIFGLRNQIKQDGIIKTIAKRAINILFFIIHYGGFVYGIAFFLSMMLITENAQNHLFSEINFLFIPVTIILFLKQNIIAVLPIIFERLKEFVNDSNNPKPTFYYMLSPYPKMIGMVLLVFITTILFFFIQIPILFLIINLFGKTIIEIMLNRIYSKNANYNLGNI